MRVRVASLLLGLALAVTACSGTASEASRSVGLPSGANVSSQPLNESPPGTLSVSLRIHGPSQGFTSVAVAGSKIWASAARTGLKRDELVEIEGATGKVVRRLFVGIDAEGIAAGPSGVWVSNASGACVVYSCGEGIAPTPAPPGFPLRDSIERFDPSTGAVTAVHLTAPGPLVAQGAFVWAIASGTRGLELFKLDGRTGMVIGRIALPRASDWSLASGAGRIWLTSESPAAVLQVDPATNRVVRTWHPPGALSATVGPSGPWVTRGGKSGSVTSINVGSHQVTTFPFTWADQIAFGNDRVWLSTGTSKLLLLDPNSFRVLAEGSGFGDVGEMVAAGRGLWLINNGVLLHVQER